ncbi:DUF2267 domain-containing protein [Streptomyces orinoci]|uniref:DUF2267 domain-containing protein n=1 Tax=Streptomyces orinoci TaxID=67339 RepID=A0ABV3K4T3_STRON|nr:DUF2267 domain-containing protein [Streptomyces orinoci]
MSSNRPPDFEHAIHTANIWLKSVAEAMGTEDRGAANRALRAWLHTVRDRLTVDVAAHLAAQLPELLRGVYYDGWDPSIVPVKYDRDAYMIRFAQEAKVTAEEVPQVTAAVTAALARQMSPGQMDSVLQELPHDIRVFFLEPVA